MKFVKENSEAERVCVATMKVDNDAIVVSVDNCNVFCLYSDKRFVVWNKHGLGRQAEGKILDLEE